ncbi:MAG: serine hydrolase domain-containing protein, partial [Pseudoxanthomonas sp.]
MLFAMHRFTTILCAALLWFACLDAAAGTVGQANRLTRQLIQQKMKEQRIPGVQIVVIKDDRIVLSETHGFANVENRVPATRSTLFPINSATKSFTGVAMMQLAEAGLVDLDAPVSRYLHDLPEAWRGIRIRQLLGHTSGL